MRLLTLAWALGACAVWGLLALRIARNAATLSRLRDRRPPDPPAWPRLSVLVAARDEAEAVEPAVASLLTQDYPDLEVVLVDDRSTDGTGAAVDRLAARDRRVVPVHVTALPDGWLGKVHALERAQELATGAWLLFTDADVHFAPGALKLAVAEAERAGVGHLALLPDLPLHGFWLRVAACSFGLTFFIVLDGRRVGEPASGVAMGIGAFNLVRRDALARTPGLEWLRLEVVDDIGLGQMLNAHGARGALLSGTGLVSVEWYRTLRAMVRGLEKGAFAALGYRLTVAWALAAFNVATIAGVAAAAFVLPAPAGPALALGTWGAYSAAAAYGIGRMGGPWWLAPFAPAGALINTWTVIRSAALCTRRGGIVWRGTFYPLAALRPMRRLRLW